MNLAFEVAKTVYGMSEECYRMLVFRYVFVIAIGVFFCIYQDRIKWPVLLLSASIGGLYLLITEYFGWIPHIFAYWSNTNLIACLWIVPVIYLCITNFSNTSTSLLKPLALLGKASFNIFLVQMVYYFLLRDIVERFVPIVALQYVLHLAICLSVGLVFFWIETPITKKLYSFIDRISNKATV